MRTSNREPDTRAARFHVPTLYELFWGSFANGMRRVARWRKQGLLRKSMRERRRRTLSFEPLEPRLLLSADVSSVGTLDLAKALEGEVVVQVDVLDSAVPAPLVEGMQQAEGFDAVAPGADASGSIALNLDASSEAAYGTDQMVFISFGGAEDVDYQGPVQIADLDVPAFRAPIGLEGRETEIISSVLTSLDQAFADSGIAFTPQQPGDGDYSTIYFGGDGAAFSDGPLYGISETIDTGNLDRTDIAFVFSDNISSAGLDASQYGALLAGYAGHELGHLLGFEHAHTVGAAGDPLAEVAWKPYTHVEVARDVLFDLFGDPNVTGDEDNMLTIDGQQYAIHPKILQALHDYPSYYFAGAVGPDGFPDFVMGQGIIHAGDNATWLTRVLDMAWAAQSDPWFSAAEKSEILAWSYGFLTHSAGDHWAHTLVNDFAEGIFPAVGEIVDSLTSDQRELANALRHFLTEAYLGDATPGFDGNPERTVLPDGDVSDDSTPGIPFDAPTRFIYESLIRPFAQDPTPLVKTDLGDDGVLTVDAATQSFARSTGSFIDDGFKVGQKITTAGFSNAANNGVFHVTAVTATALTVSETTLVGESASPASGDEKIEVFVPYTAVTTITVNDATNTFVRTSGSFKDDGFVAGQRFTAYGFHAYQGDYLVKSVSGDGLKLTVEEDLNSGYEVGNGDEQLIVQGSRGVLLDGIFTVRDKIEMAAIERGPRLDFAQTLAKLLASQVDPLVTAPSFDDLANAYLYNWVDDINAGVQDWGDVGLAFTRAMFDPQSRRDVQNNIGEDYGDDTLVNDLRAQHEDAVGIIDVLFNELDDPNNDGDIRDGYINRHLLSMFGLPDVSADVRAALHDFGQLIDDVLEPLNVLFLPIEATVAEIKDLATDFLKQQIEDVFNIDFETFEFLTKLNSKMDLATIDIGGTVIPIFKAGDHEKLDGFLGFTDPDHHVALPDGFTNPVVLPGATFTFYAGTQGALADDAEFDKATFAPYANSFTLAKMLLLMEDTDDGVGGGTAGDGGLSALFSNVLTSLNGSATTYDFSLLNLNGAHGGNVLTATLPGVPGTEGRPWLISIDGDHIWRTDSQTTTTALFRVSTQNDTSRARPSGRPPSRPAWSTASTPPGRPTSPSGSTTSSTRRTPIGTCIRPPTRNTRSRTAPTLSPPSRTR